MQLQCPTTIRQKTTQIIVDNITSRQVVMTILKIQCINYPHQFILFIHFNRHIYVKRKYFFLNFSETLILEIVILDVHLSCLRRIPIAVIEISQGVHVHTEFLIGLPHIDYFSLLPLQFNPAHEHLSHTHLFVVDYLFGIAVYHH